MKQPLMEQEAQQVLVDGMEKKKKKIRLSNEQLEALERSFEEEMKLDPDRKMKLSMELGLPPKQIAVWFQNRKARWKAKQLEHLYDTLKQEFDAISVENNMLQQEVTKLRSMLDEQGAIRNRVSMTYTDVSNEEPTESTSIIAAGSSYNYIYEVQDLNQISTQFFGGAQAQLSSYP